MHVWFSSVPAARRSGFTEPGYSVSPTKARLAPKIAAAFPCCACALLFYARAMPEKKPATARKPNAALMKPVQPDAALSKVVGSEPLPRGELTKKLWDYIKKNGLQDAKNRRQINADAALKEIFGGKANVTMFEMTKLVSAHIK